MQFPKLRLPSFSFGGGRGGRAVFLYVAYTLVLFVVFLIATFPHELVLRQALGAVGLGRSDAPIVFSAVKFAWWRGYQIDGLRVVPPPGVDGSFLELTHLWVRPILSELIRGNPYSLNLSAELYGGNLGGQIEYRDGSVRGDVAWDGLSLGRYRPLLTLLEEGQLAGRISGAVSFEAPMRNPSGAQASGDLSLDSASITGGKLPGFTIGNIAFKQAGVKFKAGGGRVEVQDLSLSGDLSVQQASGQIGVRDPIFESTLNLRANILQTATTPDWLRTLVAAIPRAPGAKLDAPVNITGTIAKPRFR